MKNLKKKDMYFQTHLRYVNMKEDKYIKFRFSLVVFKFFSFCTVVFVVVHNSEF